jgi:hypothetical protein
VVGGLLAVLLSMRGKRLDGTTIPAGDEGSAGSDPAQPKDDTT